MFKKANKLKGFTLIELLVVIAIIAILAVVIILNLTQARKKARDAQRKDDLRNFVLALEMYADDTGHYVTGLSVDKRKSTGNQVDNIFKKTGPLEEYLKSDIKDPINKDGSASNDYYYGYWASGQQWSVCANQMEISSNANHSNDRYCLKNY